MGDRKAPTPVPTNQVKPAPPPAPPAKRSARASVRIRVAGTCELFATFEMQCPLCDQIIPANTPHSCKRMEGK